MMRKIVILLTSFVLPGAFSILASAQSLPPPWQNMDIGSTGVSGFTIYENGIFTLYGSGIDIWGTADSFHYVYQSYTGDMQIIARLNSQVIYPPESAAYGPMPNTLTDGFPKAGVMIRETLDSNSRHAMMVILKGNGSSFQYRSATAGTSNAITPVPADGRAAPCWLKLIRKGNLFKGYSSVDGISWIQIGYINVNMSSSVYIGLCVTSHSNIQLSGAGFENVTISTDTTPPCPNPPTWSQQPYATSSDTIVMTALTGTDEGGTIEYYFEETSGNPAADSGGWISSPTYTDSGLKPMTNYTYVVRIRDASENTTTSSEPVSVMTLPSPDMDCNGLINASDLSNLTEHWLDENCSNNLWCGGSDLNLSGDVSFPDFALLARPWMQLSGECGHFYNWALKPPMGWNSYDCYGYCVREHHVKANADFMKTYLKQYGWEYVVIDFAWYVPDIGLIVGNPNQNSSFEPHSSLDEFGRLIPDPNRFPSSGNGAGFKPLADYIHGLGLKFGIHLMRGIPREVVAADMPIKGTAYTASQAADTSSICPWYNLMYGLNMSHPAAQAYLDSIFELYASWGVDFVKVDDLSATVVSPYYYTEEIEGYRNAIDNCGHRMVMSTSPGPTPFAQAQHISAHANMWRQLNDLWDGWGSMDLSFDKAVEWHDYIGPGHWPDLDMLPLGKLSKYGPYGAERYSNLTQDECYTMISLWCITRSPLIFGGNLPENTTFYTSIISNPEVIAVNQNSSGNRPVYIGTYPVWAADIPDSGNDKYLAVFNRSSTGPTAVTVTLSDIGIKRSLVRDLWTHTDLGEYQDTFAPQVNSHGARLFKLTVLETVP